MRAITMPLPISSRANLLTPYLSHPANVSSSDVSHISQVNHTKLGNGIALINQQRVHMTAMNQSRFIAAFFLPSNRNIVNQNKLPISSSQYRKIATEKERFSQQTQSYMQEIINTDLEHEPDNQQKITQITKECVQRFSSDQMKEIIESLNEYQGDDGSHIMMNIGAMGYPSLTHYFQATGDYQPRQSMESFIGSFLGMYESYYEDLSEDEQREEVKTRLSDRLSQPVETLRHFLDCCSPLSGVPLLKGVKGGNNPVTTQVDSDKLIRHILIGEAIHFNGFLSTSPSYKEASEFAGDVNITGFGKPQYTIDLTSSSVESEVLRREALKDILEKNCDTYSLLFYFKTHHVSGVDIRTLHEKNMVFNRFNSENEILLAPGHYMIPEKLLKNEKGWVIIGSLYNSKNQNQQKNSRKPVMI